VAVLAKQEDDLDMMMAEDLKQFTDKQPSKAAPQATETSRDASEGGLKAILDKVRIEFVKMVSLKM
jgi:hypothetical protein